MQNGDDGGGVGNDAECEGRKGKNRGKGVGLGKRGQLQRQELQINLLKRLCKELTRKYT